MNATLIRQLHQRGVEVATELDKIEAALKGTTPEFFKGTARSLQDEILQDLNFRDERGKDLECKLALFPLPEVVG